MYVPVRSVRFSTGTGPPQRSQRPMRDAPCCCALLKPTGTARSRTSASGSLRSSLALSTVSGACTAAPYGGRLSPAGGGGGGWSIRGPGTAGATGHGFGLSPPAKAASSKQLSLGAQRTSASGVLSPRGAGQPGPAARRGASGIPTSLSADGSPAADASSSSNSGAAPAAGASRIRAHAAAAQLRVQVDMAVQTTPGVLGVDAWAGAGAGEGHGEPYHRTLEVRALPPPSPVPYDAPHSAPASGPAYASHAEASTPASARDPAPPPVDAERPAPVPTSPGPDAGMAPLSTRSSPGPLPEHLPSPGSVSVPSPSQASPRSSSLQNFARLRASAPTHGPSPSNDPHDGPGVPSCAPAHESVATCPSTLSPSSPSAAALPPVGAGPEPGEGLGAVPRRQSLPGGRASGTGEAGGGGGGGVCAGGGAAGVAPISRRQRPASITARAAPQDVRRSKVRVRGCVCGATGGVLLIELSTWRLKGVGSPCCIVGTWVLSYGTLPYMDRVTSRCRAAAPLCKSC